MRLRVGRIHLFPLDPTQSSDVHNGPQVDLDGVVTADHIRTQILQGIWARPNVAWCFQLAHFCDERPFDAGNLVLNLIHRRFNPRLAGGSSLRAPDTHLGNGLFHIGVFVESPIVSTNAHCEDFTVCSHSWDKLWLEHSLFP